MDMVKGQSDPMQRMDHLRPHVLAMSLLLFAVPFAGCIGDSGGSASVSFDGSGNGSHSDSSDCDDDGTVFGSGNVDAGQVTVRVTDGDGRQIYADTFDGGVNVETEGVDGASGEWDIVATRSSDTLLGTPFSGDYSFKLSC